MKRIKVDLNNIKGDDIDLIVDYLHRGRVIVLPTDTVYGLSCLATDEKAINKIYKIKQRKDKKFLILVKGYCMLKDYFFVSRKQEEYLRTIWPRTTREAGIDSGDKIKNPTTAILKSRGLLPNIIEGEHTGAVRLPKSSFLIRIIRGVDKPIISTSFNVSGKEVPGMNEIDDYFKKHKPDLVVDVGEIKGKKPSRIISLKDINNIKILRK